MNFKKIIAKCLVIGLLVAGLVIPEQNSFADTLHPTGLATLHENIPGIQKLPSVYSGTAASLPSSVDLTSKLPPVGNQQSLGSCVAFATGYAMKTYQEGLDWKWNVNTNDHIFSPAYIYSQVHLDSSAGGGGTYFSSAFSILQNQGCTTLSDMPYNGSSYGWKTQPTDQQKANAAAYKALSWVQLTSGSYDDIRAQLANGNPVVIGISVYPDFDNLSSSNDTYDVISGTSRERHAICVIGYDDVKKAVKIINSWGTGWGLKGYGWISYNLIKSQNLEAYTMTDISDAMRAPDLIVRDSSGKMILYPFDNGTFYDNTRFSR
jgi:C1A family cysteine protease